MRIKERFIIGSILALLIVFLIAFVLFVPMVITHEYCHLAACRILGGDGKIFFEGLLLSDSHVMIDSFPSFYPEIIPLSGGVGTFLMFGLAAALAAMLRRKNFPQWLIALELPFLFWAIVGLGQGILEWHSWINGIFLTKTCGMAFFFMFAAISMLICQFLYANKIFEMVLKKIQKAV